MHSEASLDLPKLPNDVDGWKIQPALYDVTGWMHVSKKNTSLLILPWYRRLWIKSDLYHSLMSLFSSKIVSFKMRTKASKGFCSLLKCCQQPDKLLIQVQTLRSVFLTTSMNTMTPDRGCQADRNVIFCYLVYTETITEKSLKFQQKQAKVCCFNKYSCLVFVSVSW